MLVARHLLRGLISISVDFEFDDAKIHDTNDPRFEAQVLERVLRILL